jgi:hypothetical protein
VSIADENERLSRDAAAKWLASAEARHRAGNLDKRKNVKRRRRTMTKILINVRVTPEEFETLTAAAVKAGRTKTDIIREMIRSLKNKKAGGSKT